MPEHMPGPTSNRGVYGFAMHLTFRISFVMFVLWATIPEKWFTCVGITYLPQRYWAVSIPIFVLTVIATFAFVIYPSLGFIMTPEIDEIVTIRDEHSKYDVEGHFSSGSAIGNRNVGCICRNQTFCMKHQYDAMDVTMLKGNAIPTVQDLHISKVSEDLYL